MHTRLTRLAASGAAVFALGLGAAIIVPAAAQADNPSADYNTATVEWTGVDSDSGYISDGQIADFANNSYGWNDDAFDGFPDPFSLHDTNQGDWDFESDDPAVTNTVAGGTTTITATGTTSGWEDPYTVTLTLTLTGNYAHWSYAISNPTIGLNDSSVSFEGGLGSDDSTTYAVNGASLVSHDTGAFNNDDESSSDPVIAYQATSDGTLGTWDATDGDDNPLIGADVASTFDVYVALVGYTPCADGFTQAVAKATAIAPTLASTFGATYPVYGSCITVAPLSYTKGVAVNQTLSYTVDAGLAASEAWAADYWNEPAYFSPESGVQTIVNGLPGGLTGTGVQQADGSVVVTITGTPTTSGDVTATLSFSLPPVQNEDDGPDLGPAAAQVAFPTTGLLEISSDFAVAVADPAAPALAATGFNAVPFGAAAGLLLLIGAGLFFFGRRRRAQLTSAE